MSHCIDAITDRAPLLSARRRAVLKALAVAFAQVGLLGKPALVFAQPPPNSTDFLILSRFLTGYTLLNAVTAARIFAALSNADSNFVAHATALARLMRAAQTPEQLLAAAEPMGLRDTALEIVAAWYTGTVGHGTKAVLVSYAEALMYGTVSDGLIVPTYCANGPLWWTAAPPAIGAAPPGHAGEFARASLLHAEA